MALLDPELWAAFSTSASAYAFVAVLGALWGSFGNVCIYRMPPSEEYPIGRSVSTPASHCFVCGSNVRWYDNVPLLSYLWLRGACRDCKTTFSPRYLLVEGAAALLFAAAYHYVVAIAYSETPPAEQLLRFGILAAFFWLLLIITFIDFDHQLILDKLTYPAIPIFYGLGLLLPQASPVTGLVGVAVGYGVVRVISDGYWLVAGREGMGYGDGKLLAVIGALYGWQAVLVSLFLGSVLGAVISSALLLRSRGSQEGEASEPTPALTRVAVPFGPFLAAAAIVYVFSEQEIQLALAPLW